MSFRDLFIGTSSTLGRGPRRRRGLLAGGAAAIALAAVLVTILDELGHVHHPRVTAVHRSGLPAVVRPGQTVTLEVRDVLPTGGGRLRWAPEGTKPIASWDFDVEID